MTKGIHKVISFYYFILYYISMIFPLLPLSCTNFKWFLLEIQWWLVDWTSCQGRLRYRIHSNVRSLNSFKNVQSWTQSLQQLKPGSHKHHNHNHNQKTRTEVLSSKIILLCLWLWLAVWTRLKISDLYVILFFYYYISLIFYHYYRPSKLKSLQQVGPATGGRPVRGGSK